MVPERVARLLPESLPHAEVRWLNECGHMIPVECPAETARLMSEWLQNLQLKT
jgi:pimeloyl-ACP methyl ester carboxylesterase